MDEDLWKRDETKQTDYIGLCLVDPEGWWKARAKWDGCIDLDHASNSPYGADRTRDPADCYMHICDLDDLIARLQALKAKALEHFGNDWPQ